MTDKLEKSSTGSGSAAPSCYKLTPWDKGVLFAVSSMLFLVNDTTVAADVMCDAGLHLADVSALDDCEKERLRKFGADPRVNLKGL